MPESSTICQRLSIVLPLLAAGPAGAQFNPAPMVEPQMMEAKVVARRPHDPGAFTQGLQFHGGELVESTGMYGQSSVRRADPLTGEVVAGVALPREHFGEGLAIVDERVIQLTWREGVAHVWHVETLEKMGEYRYEGEGWGLCYDGKQLVMSDGTPNLTLRDPDTFDAIRKQAIIYKGRPLKNVNELEFVDGFVWANVWRTDEIVKIDAETGQVHALVKVGQLLAAEERAKADVLNGIAWNPATETFWITGKYWPAMFEVEFAAVPVPTPTPLSAPTGEAGLVLMPTPTAVPEAGATPAPQFAP